jgi:hypothetical protein
VLGCPATLSPNPTILAITSIFSFSACKVKQFLKPARPFIKFQVGPALVATLYDSGADISCFSEIDIREIPGDQQPEK